MFRAFFNFIRRGVTAAILEGIEDAARAIEDHGSTTSEPALPASILARLAGPPPQAAHEGEIATTNGNGRKRKEVAS